MSVRDSSTPRNSTNITEADNQAIKLIDTTQPSEHSDSENEISRQSTDSRWRRIAKKPTNFSVREELARRKYAKWQPDQRAELAGGSETQEPPSNSQAATSSQNAPEPTTPAESQVQQADFGDATNLQERGRSTALRAETKRAKARKHRHRGQPSEIDILYENQRGAFFFGLPLYSHSSLLNFDPAPWVTSSFKDSPVNITNAQLPDPSWEWTWKSWYVDMSYDVDEEGWQYSFSFAKKFSWHGTHPWFHSFVRRRRWLRKRTKKAEQKAEGAMSAAHMLTSEYFTIHPKRDRSLSPGSGTNGRYSFVSQGAGQENILPDEIADIATLLKSLRIATIDREKIDLVKKFIATASDDELALLHEYIQTVMSFFVFQNSGRQLVAVLRKNHDTTKDTNAKGDMSKFADNDSRTEHLRKALRAAERQIGGLEYWSDKTRSHSFLRTTDDVSNEGETKENDTPAEKDPMGTIHGISEKADVGVDFTRSAADQTSPQSFDGVYEEEVENETKKEEDGSSMADDEQEQDEGEGSPPPKPEPSVREEIGEQGEQERKETLVIPE